MSTPSESSELEMSLEKFQMWKKPALQAYLRKKDLPTTGNKNELAALCYSAWVMKIPNTPTAKEKDATKASEYLQLLTVGGRKLPDPLYDLKTGWRNEDESRKDWPCTMIQDISEHLKKHETDIDKASLRKRLLSDYKEGKAFSYFSSRFVFEIIFHEISVDSAYCFMKSTCRPSYAIHDEPHTMWVCIEKKTGVIVSAYCTCFAGLGQSCNHVTALLLKIDFCWKYGFVNPACTSLPCAWKAGGKSVVFAPKPLNEMEWKAPHAEKLNQEKVINPPVKKLFSPTHKHANKGQSFTEFMEKVKEINPKAVFLSESTDERNPIFDEHVTSGNQVFSAPLPNSIPEIAEKSGSVAELMDSCKGTFAETKVLEEVTKGQAVNELWFKHRKGRLTSSNFHDIFTRTNTYRNNPQNTDMTNILSLVMGYKPVNPHLKALKYGRNMESSAKKSFIAFMRKTHKNLKVSDAGLVVDASAVYLGTSPDGFVECECCGKGVLEIKCPISVAYDIPTDQNLPYLKEKKLKKNSKYYDQCQGQLMLTKMWGVSYCDFFVFSMHGFHYERIVLDEGRVSELKANLQFFFESIVAPELLSKSLKNKILGAEMESQDSQPSCSLDPITTFATSDSITTFATSDPITNFATSDPITKFATSDPITTFGSSDPITPPHPNTFAACGIAKKPISRKGKSGKNKSKGKRSKRNARPIFMCPICKKTCSHEQVSSDEDEVQHDSSVGCDQCYKWFHFQCVNFKETSNEEPWFCPECKMQQDE